MLDIEVLGPIRVRLDDVQIDLGSPKQRAVVAALSLFHGRPVAVDTLIDLLWQDDPPPGVTTTLQSYISRLRTALEPARQRRAAATVLVTAAPGYALRVAGEALDAQRFESAVTSEHARFTGALGEPVRGSVPELTVARDRLDAALQEWHGTPYVDLGEVTAAVAARVRLEQLRLVAIEDRAVAGLALGEHATLAAELELLTVEHPLRERLWGLRALALVRSGRQAEALSVLREVREVLSDELGLDPGPELRALQDQILRQDPRLAWTPPPAGPPAPPAAPSSPPAVPSGGPGAGRDHDRDAPALPAPRGVADATWDEASSPGGLPAPDGPGAAAWPMLGRDGELGRLVGLLERGMAGATSFAVVTGEPGIGKTRLTAELSRVALARGARVVVGRCSQDDGAPPLWPWATVLAELGRSRAMLAGVGAGAVLTAAGSVGPAVAQPLGTDFATFDEIVSEVVLAASDQPLLLVLDDLHWADTATLRTLRLLAETQGDARLLVVSTWRNHPQPVGALADLAETLARRHAVRLELTGLDAPTVGQVLTAVADRRPTAAQAEALCERTDGNPFFLIEYARLAAAPAELARLITEPDPPTAVQEVLRRRIDRLPAATVRALQTAAVIGRDFDLATLAGAEDVDEDDLLDIIDPALAAGLVRENGVDRFLFAHALVRDCLSSAMSSSRRARRHARVAQVLVEARGRETEVARHWLAAGPAHAPRAWPAAVVAARIAFRAHGHLEAAALYRAALEAQALDGDATPRNRYDVLMELVVAYRWAAVWTELTATAEEAVKVAEGLGDPVLVAQAALSPTQGGLWSSAPPGEVNARIVDVLERSLAQLPDDDSAVRCRVLLGLANELYYRSSHEHRRSLVDAALAMAERIGEPELRMDARQIAFVALWHPSTMDERLTWAEESLALARQLGAEQAVVVSATLRVVVLGELGRPQQMWSAMGEARAEAERLRIAYGLLVLDAVALPWHALAGEREACEAALAHTLTTIAGAALQHSEEAVAGAHLSLEYWFGDPVGMAHDYRDKDALGGLPLTASLVASLCKGGADDEARAVLAKHPIDLDSPGWFAAFHWSNAAIAALHVADADLAERVYALLEPLVGTCCSAGSGNAMGPADAYLALAAAAAGRPDVAARHAAEAERLAGEWGIALFADWFAEERARFGF